MATATKVDIQKLSEASLRSALYDRIYDIADRLFKKYNPCNIHIRNRQLHCTCHLYSKYRGSALCCAGCRHHSRSGCVIKCLGCKLFVCYTLEDRFPIFCKRINKLRKMAFVYGLPATMFYTSKEKGLKYMEKRDGK